MARSSRTQRCLSLWRVMGMSEVVTPDDVGRMINEISNRIAKGVPIFTERLEAHMRAEQAFEVAKSRAYVDADCPQLEKRHRAVLASQEEAEAHIVAKVAYKHVEFRMKALTEELSAWQSLAKNVRAIYGAAGVGER